MTQATAPTKTVFWVAFTPRGSFAGEPEVITIARTPGAARAAVSRSYPAVKWWGADDLASGGAVPAWVGNVERKGLFKRPIYVHIVRFARR